MPRKKKATKVVTTVVTRKSPKGKKNRKGIVEWVTGQQDLTRNPIYRGVSNRVNSVARHGPILGMFKSKKGNMGDMRNAVLRGGKGKISSIKGSSSNSRPYITTISERMERIETVVSATNFTNIIQCAINPGLPRCFPWLSTVAANYELYKFNKLWFEYRTTSGEVMSGTNPALGKVIMATNYDVIQPPFTSIEAMENYEGNANFPPYQTVARHQVDVAGRSMGMVLPYQRRYVRNAPVPDTTAQGGAGDPHAYDIGLFQVATQGCPATGNQVGELWVGYSIDLIKPRPSIMPVIGDTYFATGTCRTGSSGPTIPGAFFQTILPAQNPSLVVDYITGPFTTFTIRSPNARSFLINIYAEMETNVLTNATIELGDGCVFTDLQAGFNPFGMAIANDVVFTQFNITSSITALPGFSECTFRVVFPTSTVGVAVDGISRLSVLSYAPPAAEEFAVFKKRDLATHSELNELRKAISEMKLQLEEKDEIYSVVSSVRNSSPVRKK